MKDKYIHILLIVFLLPVLSVSCRQKNGDDRLVTVSILPQQYFVEKIAGDYIRVNVMVPPGMSPATCDLNTEQLKNLYDSKICFTIGHLPFETTHLYPVLQNRRDILVVNHSEGQELIAGSCGHVHKGESSHEPEGVDPHIWLSPKYARNMAGTIFRVLSEKYPEHKAQFKTNYEQLVAEIDSVDHRAVRILSQKQHKSFLIYHPALTYLAKDYGMEQISIEDEGKEPHPAHLKKIIDQTQEKDIHIIFIQSQFDINNAEAIARETGAKLVQIDPLNPNWTEEMNRLLGIFETNLN